MVVSVRVLNVAEKPSVAKEVARILSNTTASVRSSHSPYNKVFEFPFTLNGEHVTMVFTSVTGHLMELDFDGQYKSWNSVDDTSLLKLSTPVTRRVPDSKKDIARTLDAEMKRAHKLVLWLDCDAEGENIGFEVLETCRKAKNNANFAVLRAKFSSLVPAEVHRAVQSLGQPDARVSESVDARQEMDLRIGAAFTRFQTKLFRGGCPQACQWLSSGERGPLVSYGPCQFPTLGFVVSRDWEIQNHAPEDFWTIKLVHRFPMQHHVNFQQAASASNLKEVTFEWARGRLYDQECAAVLHDMCVEHPVATIVSADGRQVTKQQPLPLATIEMTKRLTRYTRMSGQEIMNHAEKLYQEGYISYPRTETDQFPEGFDFTTVVREQQSDQRWAPYAMHLIAKATQRAVEAGAPANQQMWCPRRGGGNDQAHPPITPVKKAPEGGGNWSSEKKAVYEFVVRHFLACLGDPAVGVETRAEANVAGELFEARGRTCTERNYLDVYRYESFGGDGELPPMEPGMEFSPDIRLVAGRTSPPPRLTESDLIALMERHGIGTDATMHQHIHTLQERRYVVKHAGTGVGQIFESTWLGEALVTAYQRLGQDKLWRPFLRGAQERDMAAIARGEKRKHDVLAQFAPAFEAVLDEVVRRKAVLKDEVEWFAQTRGCAISAPTPSGGGFGGGGGGAPGGGEGGRGGGRGGRSGGRSGGRGSGRGSARGGGGGRSGGRANGGRAGRFNPNL
ncbi:DNA topoisomerase III [Pseudoscourfieldia marina]